MSQSMIIANKFGLLTSVFGYNIYYLLSSDFIYLYLDIKMLSLKYDLSFIEV